MADGGGETGTGAGPAGDRGGGGVGRGARAMRGFAWLFGQSVGGRLIGLLGQLVLAKLLVPEMFGLLALAQTASALTSQLQTFGLRTILIQRRERVGPWVNPAWWFAGLTGLIAASVLAASGPIVAMVYGEPEVVGVVLVLALAAIPQGLYSVPDSLLRGAYRFKEVAALEFGRVVSMAVLSVVLAALGLGAYALVIPFPVVGLLVLLAASGLAKPRVRARPQARRWRYLIAGGWRLTLAKVALIGVNQGDKIALGLFTSTGLVGVYFFAYQLTAQIVPVLSNNIRGVLMPTLSEFQKDSDRALDAFVRAVGLLTLIGFPLTLAQAAFAAPFIETLFDEKWYGAVVLIQALSFGMAYRVSSVAGESLIVSQRRFTAKLVLNLIQAPIFVVLVMLTAWQTDSLGVAIMVSAFHTMSAPLVFYIAGRPHGLGVGGAVSLLLRPMLIMAIGVGGGMAAVWWLPEAPFGTWRSALLGYAAGCVAYGLAASVLAQGIVVELLRQVRAAAPGPAKRPARIAEGLVAALPEVPWGVTRRAGAAPERRSNGRAAGPPAGDAEPV